MTRTIRILGFLAAMFVLGCTSRADIEAKRQAAEDEARTQRQAAEKEELARRCADEALQIAERYGGERGVVYALMACGSASALAQQWAEGNAFLERAQQRIRATGAGAEWSVPVDAFQALCLAGLGERARSLNLVRRSAHGPVSGLRPLVGFIRGRALRVVSAVDELDAEIAETLAELQRVNGAGLIPLLLLERAGLARLRGDPEGMARDLAEARRLFAQMDITRWDDYAQSIET